MGAVKDLFRITEGDAVYRFTSSNETEYLDVELLTESGDTLVTEAGVLLIDEVADDYPPRVVGRSEVKDTANYLKDTFDLTTPLLDTIAQHFIASPVDYVARIELYTRQADGSLTVEWRGTLADVAPSEKECKLTWNSSFASNRTAGKRPVHTRLCRHTLYARSIGRASSCDVVFDDFKVAATVTGISPDGLTLTLDGIGALPSGYLNAGVFVAPDGTRRFIRAHSGSTIALIRRSPSIEEAIAAAGGDPVDVFVAPGCSQKRDRCTNLFNNLPNYGGFPAIPLSNPNASNII